MSACAGCGGPAEPGAPCPACGGDPLLDGRFRFDAVIGRGGTGTTWRATRLEDGLVVAVKAQPLAADRKASELEDRELRVLREIDHPQLPRLLEVVSRGVGHQRVRYLVQTFMDGEDLSVALQRKRFTAVEVAALMRSALEPLGWLHALSPPVVHRDVKPANLILRPDGSVALVDFGAVRDVLKGTLGGSTVAGTFGFMAPEQFRGDAEPATDLYGLGATAIHLLTRREPHGLLDLRQRFAWRPHAAAPPALCDLVDDLTEPLPSARPRQDEVIARLDAIVDGRPVPPSARASGWASEGRRPAARSAVEAAPVGFAEPETPVEPAPFDEQLIPHAGAPAAAPKAPEGPRLRTWVAFTFFLGVAATVGGAVLTVARAPSPAPPPVPVVTPAPAVTPVPSVAPAVAYIPTPSMTTTREELVAVRSLVLTSPVLQPCVRYGRDEYVHVVGTPAGVQVGMSHRSAARHEIVAGCLADAPVPLVAPDASYGFSGKIVNLDIPAGERMVAFEDSIGGDPKGTLTIVAPPDAALDLIVHQEHGVARVVGGGEITVPIRRGLDSIQVFRFGETDPARVHSLTIREGSCTWHWDQPDKPPVCRF